MKNFNSEESQEIMKRFKSIISSRLDKLYDRFGPNVDGELYAYSIAVNGQRRKQEKEPTTEELMDKETKLKEMIQAALSKPLSEKKKSSNFTSEYDDKFDDKRKDLPDGLQKAILKKQGELDEGKGQDKAKQFVSLLREKVFKNLTDDELEEFKQELALALDMKLNESTISEDMDLGHEDDEPHMLKADLYRIGKYAMELYKMVDQFDNGQEVDFPHWWQAKIINAKSCLVAAKHYLDFEIKEPKINAMVDVAAQEDIIDERDLPAGEEKIVKGIKKSGDFKKNDPSLYAIARSIYNKKHKG